MNNIRKTSTIRRRRAARGRGKISGVPEKPRLAVYRSNRFMYAQLIDDVAGRTLAFASSREIKEKKEKGGKSVHAQKVGALIGERAIAKGIKKAVFDRRQYRYHGRVKALAEGARSAGLTF